MDIVTDSYDNISVNQILSKLSIKYAELRKVEETSKIQDSESGDYYDISTNPSGKYDEQDFARVLEKFKSKDIEVMSHEQVHATIGHTTAPISYTYQQGPDGKMYRVGGSVRLDTSIPDDPKAASFKLDMIKKAAIANPNPSGADIGIATKANINRLVLEQQTKEA